MWSANQPDFFPQRSSANPFPSMRRSLVAAGSGLVAMIWIHALIALAGFFVALAAGGDSAPGGLGATGVDAWQISLAALCVGLVAGLSRRFLGGLAASVLALGALSLAGLDSLPATLAFLALGPVLGLQSRRFRRALPMAVGDVTIRRRWARVGVAAMVVLSLVQIGRLSTYLADPSSDWFLTTRDPFWAKHVCLTAYLHGAELHERGEPNVYAAEHYPGLHRNAAPVTDMIAMTVEDPFQYPPQFLLLPALARVLSHDFLAIQVVWFAVQASLFLAVAWALAVWVGGRAGRLAALLIPLALTAFPLLHALQYGQFHLTAVVLSMAALLAFESRRNAAGGALLALAISAKVFPALLLVLLTVRRRWQALGWTAGFGVAVALLGLAILGLAPYQAFFEYQVPRLVSGQAFAFGEAWPEIQSLLVADNQGAHGIVLKLQALGLDALGDGAARWATRLFFLLAAALTAFFALRESETPRHLRVAGWIAILGLGAMTSPGAFGDYVPLTATWLLTFVAGLFHRSRPWAVFLGACWLFHYTLLGTAPIGAWFDPGVMIPVSLAAALLMFGLYGSTLGGLFATASARALRRATHEGPQPAHGMPSNRELASETP